MKKRYIKPEIGKGCLEFEHSLLTTSVLKTGDDITSGTVDADSRGNGGSFWDDTE